MSGGPTFGPRYAWYVVLLLTATQLVSYLDRFLPSLLLKSIKADLNATDFEIGLLMGPAFGLFYVLVAVPLGWLADRGSRRLILAAGIALWCTMTVGGAFVLAFVPLFMLRLGVGLGEAAVAPCAVSLISDYFPRETRARAMSVFMAGTFLGAGTAFLAGGPLVAWIGGLPPFELPGVGALRPWQMAFLIVGLPGFALAALMFTVREPPRTERVQGALRTDAGGNASLSAAFGYIRARWRAFGALMLGSSSMVVMGSLTFWNVALFERTWGWGVRDVGIGTGLMLLAGGTLGTLLGIRLSQHWIAQGRKDATFRSLWVGLAIAAPGFAISPLMPTPQLALGALLFAFMGQAVVTPAGPASLSLIAPGQIRSQSTAIYFLVVGACGQIIGPTPVGLMTDLFGDPAKLRYAMAIQAAVVGVLALGIVALGMGAYRRSVEELERLLAAGAGADAGGASVAGVVAATATPGVSR
ncbi:MAG: MFS transporter [Steroidobacteraceae bacterium]